MVVEVHNVDENPSAAAGPLYQALMRHFLHQDRLIYMNIPYLTAIQTATLGGSWAIADYDHFLGAALAVLGAAVTWCYLMYVTATIADRNVNLLIMDKLAEELQQGTSAMNYRPVRMNAWPEGRLFRKLRVTSLVRGVTMGFIVFDVIFGGFLAYGLHNPAISSS